MATIAAMCCLLSPPASPQSEGTATFEDVTALLGPLAVQQSYGTTWSDLDSDGWPDLYLNNHNSAPPYVLRNTGGTSFADISADSALARKIDHHSCKWADYDRDKDWDLFCSTGANEGKNLDARMQLFRNNGNLDFDDVAVESGILFAGGRGRSASWLDIDRDGDLDLFVGTVTTEPVQPMSRIYRNDGASFTDVTAQSGVALNGWARISLPLDVDGDDDTDLLIAFSARSGATTPCVNCIAMLINDGIGQFQMQNASAYGLNGAYQQAIAVGDYDNDGDLDVFQGTGTPSAMLHRNNGNMTFSEVPLSAAGLTAVDDFPIVDAQWADFDNDGHLDLYVIRQSADDVSNAPNILYLNDGDATFSDATMQFNASGLSTGRGDAAAIADFDKNGFLDVIVANGFQQTKGNYQLLRNLGNSNRWLRVLPTDAEGHVEFGSKVWVSAGGSTQFRELSDNGGAAASHEYMLHFGLGGQDSVDSVRVRWPDGAVAERGNVAAGQQIEIAKPSTSPVLVAVPSVINLLQVDAEQVVQAAGLLVATVDTGPSESVPAGHVIAQSPIAGTQVSPGSGVALVVSTGSSTASVPDVVNLSQEAAISALAEAGFAAGQVTRVFSDTISAGRVVAQNPAGGTSAILGSSVALVVSYRPDNDLR